MIDAWGLLIHALGAHVRGLRQRAGWSQDELARRAGLSQGAISRLEMGTHQALPLHTMVSIAGVFGAMLTPLDGTVPRGVSALLLLARDFPLAVTTPGPLPDPALTSLLDAYHALSPPRRAVFTAMALPLIAHLLELRWVPTAIEVPPPLSVLDEDD